MVYKITADHVLTPDGSWSDDTLIITDHSGLILGLDHNNSHDPASVRKLSGVLVPGLINTHCHLELSHMRDKVDTGTGLLPFLNSVVSYRNIEQGIIDQAIIDGNAEMIKNGIVAVGDISNKADTAHIKSSSQIDYYTFVEMFDFMQPSMTHSTILQYEPVMEAQSNTGHNKKSYVPHAPYTVSPELFKYVNDHNKTGSTISIHNQETPDEDQLFIDGSGGFTDFFNGFGMNMEHFKPLGKSSMHYTIQHLKSDFNTIFVHNTMTTAEDILAADRWNKNIYWATCPNANLYIENRLPNYKTFLDTDAKVTIGTDSLTSNWQLSIWEEIKTIKKYQSFVTWGQLFSWATINGAEALGYNDRLGSIEAGKTPGLVWLDQDINNLQNAKLQRII